MLACAALLVSSCGSDSKTNYTVTYGPVSPELEGTMAYLYDWDKDVIIDSVMIDSMAVFSGHVDKPFIGRLTLGGGRGPLFIVEPGTIDLVKMTGSPLNEQLQALTDSMTALGEEYQMIDRSDSTAMARELELMARAEALTRDAYEKNKTNPLGLYYFIQEAYEMNLQGLDSALAANPALGESARVKKLRDAFVAKEETSVGKPYKDFTVTYDGKEQKLSDYVGAGHYTLVDFWASWCGPCMRQAAVIKELYDKYKDRGLQVVGVAVWDEPENTLKAIESHGLVWPNIINGQTLPTDLYGISGIPCILLINPEGIIVSRDRMGQELVDEVDAAMAESNAWDSETNIVQSVEP